MSGDSHRDPHQAEGSGQPSQFIELEVVKGKGASSVGTAALKEWIPVARIPVALSWGCCTALVPLSLVLWGQVELGLSGILLGWNHGILKCPGLSTIHRWRRWPTACSFEKVRSWVAFGTWHAGDAENLLLKECF